MKKVGLFLFAILFAFLCITGCTKYSSHYTAVLYAHSNDADSASASFYKFEGTEIFKMKIERGKTAKIQYSGKLESGSLTVYYDFGGTKTEMFSMHSGDEVNAYSDELSTGTVYVIIETSELCESGDLVFDIIYN